MSKNDHPFTMLAKDLIEQLEADGFTFELLDVPSIVLTMSNESPDEPLEPYLTKISKYDRYAGLFADLGIEILLRFPPHKPPEG